MFAVKRPDGPGLRQALLEQTLLRRPLGLPWRVPASRDVPATLGRCVGQVTALCLANAGARLCLAAYWPHSRIMGLNISFISGRKLRQSLALLATAGLAACGAAPADSINDPFEPTNRKIHAFNKGVDSALLGPASKGYGIVPEPVKRAVGNVADTLDLPGDIANNLLQLRLVRAAENTLRLATNLTFGLGGTIDMASELGLPERPTDFGETLHVWGVGEGPYIEVPLSGPSTVRDTVGTVVDVALNPVRLALPEKEAMAATVLKVFSRLGDRDRFSDTVDSLLYDSADSYAQARLLYLQNRRFELGQGGGASAEDGSDDGFIDPYADTDPGTAAAAAPADAGFIDPYEDPYAE
jgi:phospholipid-binding lipoprotein MlaA